ncbi:uncharacterized protein TRIADDRAFT_63799 [Trichoplax adhaerens]|uniref:SCP domain-containing protein n=1 Tax=Trichoplax adhaerens TaxID=10228 RepID=B3RTD2_TRIAD|nr:hypothetical protein TRIADDRAFT_63799 [Trichoplax adhaerens]EDV27205.1 hypothetical protein TRIADDRAFT_63799 [Trichoplax adhaerens]|eukprot:XP_002111201.1 hypothetical protein TRIADDRAFT_63799 [Trichoplax adhaerens]
MGCGDSKATNVSAAQQGRQPQAAPKKTEEPVKPQASNSVPVKEPPKEEVKPVEEVKKAESPPPPPEEKKEEVAETQQQSPEEQKEEPVETTAEPTIAEEVKEEVKEEETNEVPTEQAKEDTTDNKSTTDAPAAEESVATSEKQDSVSVKEEATPETTQETTQEAAQETALETAQDTAQETAQEQSNEAAEEVKSVGKGSVAAAESNEQEVSNEADKADSQSEAGVIAATLNVPDTELTGFKNDFLIEINEYRTKHKSEPLAWSTELAAKAQQKANDLIDEESIKTTPVDEYGESLAMYLVESDGNDDGVSGDMIARMWYNEKDLYNFELPGFINSAQHFSQLVWASTEKIGIAHQCTPDGQSIIVALYSPRGNKEGEFETNVKVVDESITDEEVADPDGELDKLQKDCFKAHNKYRRMHGSSALSWCNDLADKAKTWTDNIAQEGKVIRNDEDNDVGDSMGIFSFKKTVPEISGKKVADDFYNQKEEYDFTLPGYKSKAAKFTQMIWSGSKEIGIGVSKKNSKTVVVAYYSPKGNVEGEFQNNVVDVDNN